MAVGDLKLEGLHEAHRHLLLVYKEEVGLVLLLLDQLRLVAGNAVGIKQDFLFDCRSEREHEHLHWAQDGASDFVTL